MRQLVLMHGSIASGKTTWIKKNNLEDYVISPDEIRVRLGGFSNRGFSVKPN